MDSVRFGRALGIGARQAAKALVSAADAASAPNPSTSAPRPAAPTPVERTAATLGQRAARTTEQVRKASAGITRGGKRFGEAAWGPFVRLSGVLWLELTGVFFGLFVITAAANAWKLRGDLHDTGLNHAAHQHLLWSVAMAAVFGYFSISSFVRAARKQRW